MTRHSNLNFHAVAAGAGGRGQVRHEQDGGHQHEGRHQVLGH